MSDTKRYYWLKLSEDFFRQKEIKQLRKLAGGDTFTIIYLKMLLRSMTDGGRLYYEGIEKDFASELALDIDEELCDVEVTVSFLLSRGILVQCNTAEWEVLTAKEMTGSECESARRVRKLRQKEQLALQSNGDVTSCNTEIDIEIEKSKSKNKSKNNGTTRFVKPTIEELSAYALEIDYNLDPQAFMDYYDGNGWMVGKNHMKDWKAAVRTWKRRAIERGLNTRANRPEPTEPDITPEQAAEARRILEAGGGGG